MLQDLSKSNLDSVLEGVVRETRLSSDVGLSELRMWLFIRKDLPMPAGKLAVQSGHGFGTCLWLANGKNPALVSSYMEHAQGKISVGVKDEDELLKMVEACKEAGLVSVAVQDAARTVFSVPTFTVGAVGPCYRTDLPKKVARLRLFQDYASGEDG